MDTKDNQDDQTKKPKKPNVFVRLFLCWMLPLLYQGNKREILEEDLIPPSKGYDSDALGAKFERYWIEELERSIRNNKKPSLNKALWRCFVLSYLPGALLVLGTVIPRTIQPFLFTRLLSYWSADTDMSRQEAGYYALMLLGINFVGMISQHHNNLFVGRFGMKVRVASCSLMFRKLLRLSNGSLQEVAAGKLVNLMSNDVARFDYAFMFLHYFWVIPIQAAVILYLLYDIAGWAPLVGLVLVLVIFLPLQAILTKMTAVVRRSTAKKTDTRIKLMNEIINGIQVIKMYAWEIPFQKVVKIARNSETDSLRNANYIQGTFNGFMMFTERSSVFVTILTYVLTGSMATATTLFPIQKYLSIIQMNLAIILPFAIAQLSEVLVSLNRIQEFLIQEEREDLSKMPGHSVMNGNITTFNSKTLKPQHQSHVVPRYNVVKEEDSRLLADSVPENEPRELAVELDNVSASWVGSNDQMTLKNISLKMTKGKFYAVIGAVGSGKSSLLECLIRELPPLEGKINVNGSISYACQDAWLFPATVRDNILFGLPYEPRKYQEVCKVCCLRPDFEQFPYRDLSLVGERGVSLSGGQRARINLARAVYRDADIYLLDDPLSAVDANVGRLLFEKCINGYLRNRTVILVTHQVHFVKAADFIIVLEEGSVKKTLLRSESVTLLQPDLDLPGSDKKGELKRRSFQRGMSIVSATSDHNPETEKTQVMAVEERAKGNIKWAVVYEYLKSVNSWFIVFMTLFTMILTQAVASAADYWISYWTNNVDEYILNLPEGVEPDSSLQAQTGPLTTAQFVGIHGGLVGAVIILSFVRLSCYVTMTIRASKSIHNYMFKNLIKAVMRFFDTNPSGRVLNRFSKDMGAMDELLPRAALQTLQFYLTMASVLVLNAISLPWTLIVTFVLLALFIILLKYYLNAAQAIKRLESTTKSPVLGMISSTISGMSTIRCFDAHERLIQTFDTCQNLHTNAFHTYLGGSTSFGFYLDILCLVYLAIIMSLFILIDFGSVIPVGSVGLAISQSMMLTSLLQMTARFTADLLGQLTAVERVLEYTKLPLEENVTEGPTKPPADWPSKGDLKFQGVSMKYSPDDPPVLNNINFSVESGWKIGVVGRTGAGKSSLISALFRLSFLEGIIKIDDIETEGIAKQFLRSKISIIPQEPVLFSATVRYNLDPFNVYSDDEIWRSLGQVELKEVIPALDFKVSERGSNFSVGQRQLMCLARAVLRSNKILVLDEATANVDPKTDALIQKTIRVQFSNCTVLTIAHRLNTIMDSDRVLVMDKGQVAEFDHPYILLNNPRSRLSLMVDETGEDTKKTLYEMAKNKYLSLHPQK